MGGLAIYAHDGFGPTKADQQPATIFEFELETIYRNEFDDFQPADRVRVCAAN